jgi:CheY-like chemotaxis protein
LLSAEGYQVICAATGEEGIRLARELRPAAITLDVLMPGTDGWATLATLKEDPELAHVPVIMLTIVDDKGMGYALGASDYLTKPVSRQRLLDAIARHRARTNSPVALIVEDDAMTRSMFRRVLEAESWRVSEAENGRVALQRLTQMRPHVILLDLAMPEMDGFAFLRELRRHPELRTIHVIVITARDLTEADRQILNGQVIEVLQKGPVARDQLLADLTRLLKQHLGAKSSDSRSTKVLQG